MNRATEDQLKTTLTGAIQDWWDSVPSADGVPYLGSDCFEIMAAAALAVLRGIADAQETAIRDGYLKESEGS